MSYKRKKLNLSVKHKFQIWLLIRIVGMVIISSIMAALILYFYSRQELSSNFYDAHIKLRRVSDLLLPVIAAGSFVSLLSGMFMALFLPQKIAGPLFSIENNIRNLGTGNLKVKVQLRRDDILDELAEITNNSIANLRESVILVKNAQIDLEESLAEYQDSEINKNMAQLKTSLGAFDI